MKITTATARKLGWYIYVYVNPLDDKVFYVGKGRGRRLLAHLSAAGRGPIAEKIRSIRNSDSEPRLEVLAHGIKDATTALQIEAAVIDALGPTNLSNRVRGWHAAQSGRAPASELIARYEKRRVDVREPAILIRINRLYQPSMTAAELYDATRGVWRVGECRTKARLAFAVFEGVVREVYEIATWLQAGKTFMTRKPSGERLRGRWEFVGRVAPKNIRRRYIDRYVGHLFHQGAQNPVQYVNVKAVQASS